MTLENKIIAIMLGTTAVLMAPMLIWFASVWLTSSRNMLVASYKMAKSRFSEFHK